MAVATKTTQTKNNTSKTTAKVKVNGSNTQKDGKLVSEDAIKPVNMEALVKKFNKMSELTKQRARLIERKDQAEAFEFGSDKMLDRLIITDGFGAEFKTTNSGLIAKVNEALVELLSEAILKVEHEIIYTKF